MHKTLLVASQKHFPQARCIIDCSEIARATSFKARAQTYSNYKKHNTVKFLIGITPTDIICFITMLGWQDVRPGTDKMYKPGDVILADRGFLMM